MQDRESISVFELIGAYLLHRDLNVRLALNKGMAAMSFFGFGAVGSVVVAALLGVYASWTSCVVALAFGGALLLISFAFLEEARRLHRICTVMHPEVFSRGEHA